MRSGSVSVVIPTYNVARFVPDFLASLDAQQAGLDGFELIFVDDGSPDESAELIATWIARSKADARIVSKPNGGLSSARNAGLDVATGEWVTFWDPDDMLTAEYTGSIREFLNSPRAADVQLVVGRLVFFDDDTGLRRKHPLDYRFRMAAAAPDGVVDLVEQPHLIHLAANTGFYRRSVLDEHGMRFDGRVVPTFEDGHLTSLYLGKFARPMVAFRDDALYLYRQRGDQSSLVQTGWSKETKFRNQPRHGWLSLLRGVEADRGGVPRWAQNVVLYELQWYFQAERRLPIRTGWVPPALATEFHDTLSEVTSLLDAHAIEDFGVPPARLHPDLVNALLIGVKGLRARPPHVTIDQLDERRQLMRVRYYYGGELPAEDFRVDGARVTPAHAKTRRIDLVGRTLAHERIVWLTATETPSVTLDGEPMRIAVGPLANVPFRVPPWVTWPALAGREAPKPVIAAAPTSAAAAAAASGSRAAMVRWHGGRLARSLRRSVPDTAAAAQRRARDEAALRLAHTPWARKTYRNAWLLMDRDTQAQDNAEHLYRYLRAHKPGVNAHFVLNRDSRDWPRLEAEGFRLIAHASLDHKIALLNARHVISSQADHYVMSPLHAKRFGERTWRFTFLQHGVIKDDLSVWLNPKRMDLMLTTTEDEHASIVGDGSPYVFTTNEIVRTGLPRHDRLRRLDVERAGQPRRTILVAPTWRLGLLGDRIAGGNERELRADFWQTPYARAWREVLESPRLHKAAEAGGYDITFLPHPNMQGYVTGSALPQHIAVHRFDEVDIQELLVSSAVVLTDYSSLAFDAAYIDRPVVYHQFDRAEFATGMHVYRAGTWSYADQGFGPVRTETDPTVDELVRLLESGGTPEPEYAARMAATFTLRDGKCSERAFKAIRALDRVAARADVYRDGLG